MCVLTVLRIRSLRRRLLHRPTVYAGIEGVAVVPASLLKIRRLELSDNAFYHSRAECPLAVAATIATSTASSILVLLQTAVGTCRITPSCIDDRAASVISWLIDIELSVPCRSTGSR